MFLSSRSRVALSVSTGDKGSSRCGPCTEGCQLSVTARLMQKIQEIRLHFTTLSLLQARVTIGPLSILSTKPINPYSNITLSAFLPTRRSSNQGSCLGSICSWFFPWQFRRSTMFLRLELCKYQDRHITNTLRYSTISCVPLSKSIMNHHQYNGSGISNRGCCRSYCVLWFLTGDTQQVPWATGFDSQRTTRESGYWAAGKNSSTFNKGLESLLLYIFNSREAYSRARRKMRLAGRRTTRIVRKDQTKWEKPFRKPWKACCAIFVIDGLSRSLRRLYTLTKIFWEQQY